LRADFSSRRCSVVSVSAIEDRAVQSDDRRISLRKLNFCSHKVSRIMPGVYERVNELPLVVLLTVFAMLIPDRRRVAVFSVNRHNTLRGLRIPMRLVEIVLCRREGGWIWLEAHSGFISRKSKQSGGAPSPEQRRGKLDLDIMRFRNVPQRLAPSRAARLTRMRPSGPGSNALPRLQTRRLGSRPSNYVPHPPKNPHQSQQPWT